MGKQLVWLDRFNIGVEHIDKEHQKLFKIVNKLFEFGDEGAKSQWACQEGIKYFKDHAMIHFAHEEEYMESIHYEGLERHKRIHNDFRNKILPALESELEVTRYSTDSVSHFLGVCVGWLIGHTLTEDRAMAGHAESRWEKLLPEEEHAAMVKLITQLIHDLFRLDSHVITESYGGEKFGKGIYYRLVYANKAGERHETIIVFEERVILNTTGKLMDPNAKKVNVTMMNATRYTARQLVEYVLKAFPPMENYELKSENLLTYEQFQKVYDRDDPQFSILMDTGEGYFAYCSIAPRHKVKVGSSIKAENAMVEVGEYLKHNKEEQKEIDKKKKILVVDDSKLVLQAMKQLLDTDYEILLADSGMSAFRSIILDRPDLVMLDYEMPICDGKQVLEMIRSEDSMADIAVMFLTGRSDPETIRQVLALKPVGYLIKAQPPEAIKKNVDAYFAKVPKQK
ncbi:MAG: response regulator [Lachnoclostridium sp.]|nr:response regulator [Lachnospira sp.]MCM1247406.1 response regulator [Lachnoclostridium sp.]